MIRPSILKRDAYKCRVCGAKQREYGYFEKSGAWVPCDEFMQSWAKREGKKIQRIYLQVAHIDQNPSNNSESNLKTLCPRHHLAFDREFNRIKRLAK